ncbi:MAG: DUF5663 domain-containing protein [Candidatus Paceibacterota bacterium]
MSNLINLLKLEKLPIGDKKLLIDEASDLLEVRVLTRVLKSLEEDKRNEFANILTEENQEDIFDFIEGNNIDVISIMEEEIQVLKNELKEEILID